MVLNSLLLLFAGTATLDSGAGVLNTAQDIASTCALVVTRSRPIHVGIHGNSKMAYHFFLESADSILSQFRGE